MSSDDSPDFIAMMDQARSQLGELARTVRSYHATLVAEGFTEEQALALTLSFQMAVFRGGAQE